MAEKYDPRKLLLYPITEKPIPTQIQNQFAYLTSLPKIQEVTEKMETNQDQKSKIMQKFLINPIGHVRADFQRRSDAPRQPLLETSKGGIIEVKGVDMEHIHHELAHATHMWVIFVFDRNIFAGFSHFVHPPRFKNRKLGVFATRTPFRPNPIGLSIVQVENIEIREDQKQSSSHSQSYSQTLFIQFNGGDILSQTPILALKPYDHEREYFPNVKSGWLDDSKYISPLYYDEHDIGREGNGNDEEYSMDWILNRMGIDIRQQAIQQLRFDPLLINANKARKKTRRAIACSDGLNILAIGSFRILFEVENAETDHKVIIRDIISAYREEIIQSDSSTDAQIKIHSEFAEQFKDNIQRE
ncbi:MAG: putative methyltransferase, YaeB family [Streblomastix strix]|uniref:Putative methyltransferase, YaeB family n=1 Tax=Streblomastix strix TaxID=222440 RepID=A0A5J4VWY7_9EUKA|nr:MAG: putative methyltransferase, YaeB family [Streblomastix strix]